MDGLDGNHEVFIDRLPVLSQGIAITATGVQLDGIINSLLELHGRLEGNNLPKGLVFIKQAIGA